MKNLRILVVEDNAVNRRLVRDVLSYRGHEIVEATGVPEGWSELRRNVPDVVLLDIEIPGGGGETLLREIRRDPLLSHVPVIAVTALAMPGDRVRLLRGGFDGYLSKPIDVKTFASDVEAIVNGKGVGDVS